MSEPLTVRLSETVRSHLSRKSEDNGTSISEEARKHIEESVNPSALAETYLIALYGLRADNWLKGRVEEDATVATGAIAQTRQLHISPELKRAIVRTLAHYLTAAAKRVNREMREDEIPQWNYGGGGQKTSMSALRAAYVAIYGETGDLNPQRFEEFIGALEDGDITHAFSLK